MTKTEFLAKCVSKEVPMSEWREGNVPRRLLRAMCSGHRSWWIDMDVNSRDGKEHIDEHTAFALMESHLWTLLEEWAKPHGRGFQYEHIDETHTIIIYMGWHTPDDVECVEAPTLAEALLAAWQAIEEIPNA